jgi:hypothetical protein
MKQNVFQDELEIKQQVKRITSVTCNKSIYLDYFYCVICYFYNNIQ